MPFDLFHRGASYTLIRQDGFTVGLPQALRTKRYVLLFLASHWWAPCRGVTAQLKHFYDEFHATHNFDVIFLSTDKSEQAMLNFFHDAHGDWLCLNYADARQLEAELAGDRDLHPKQIPACLVFEIDGDALMGGGAGQDVHSSAPSDSSFSASTPGQSFARLITKQGREMLSRDKQGVLFPWYDDGWSDATALQRSADKRKTTRESTSAAATSPSPSPPPLRSPADKTGATDASDDPGADATEGEAAADAGDAEADTAVAKHANATPTTDADAEDATPRSDLVPAAKHVDVVMHTNPRASPSVATPHTQLIVKHPPASTEAVEAEEKDTAKREVKDEAAEEKEETRKSQERELDGVKQRNEAPLPTKDEGASAPAPDMSLDTPQDAAPDSQRQLSYPESPEGRHESETEEAQPPSRVIVVGRGVAASMQAEMASEKGDGEGPVDRERSVELHEVLEARISAVMDAEDLQSDALAAAVSGEDSTSDDDGDVDEVSVVEKELSGNAPVE